MFCTKVEVYNNGVLFSDNFDLPFPPTSLVEESKSFESITLSCSQKLSLKVTGVVVHYRNLHNPQDFGKVEAANCAKVVVSNLRPLSFYTMAIQQTTLVGNSGFSSPLTSNTLFASSPAQLEVFTTTTSATVTFLPPAHHPPLLGNKFRYTASLSSQEGVLLKEITSGPFVFDQLNPATHYKISVTASLTIPGFSRQAAMQEQQQGGRFEGQDGSFSMQWSGRQQEVGRANYTINGKAFEQKEGTMDGGFQLQHVDQWGEEGDGKYVKNAEGQVQAQGRVKDGVYRQEGSARFGGTGEREAKVSGGIDHRVWGVEDGKNVAEAELEEYSRKDEGRYKDTAQSDYMVKSEVGPTGYKEEGAIRYQADKEDEDEATEEWNYNLQGQDSNGTYSELGGGTFQEKGHGKSTFTGQGAFVQTEEVKDGIVSVRGSAELKEAGSGSATRTESLSMGATGMEGEDRWKESVEENQQGSAFAQMGRETYTQWGFQDQGFGGQRSQGRGQGQENIGGVAGQGQVVTFKSEEAFTWATTLPSPPSRYKTSNSHFHFLKTRLRLTNSTPHSLGLTWDSPTLGDHNEIYLSLENNCKNHPF